MSDERFLLAMALVSAGAGFALASYGLRRWLAIEAPQQATQPAASGPRVGAVVVLAGLMVSSATLIERIVWMLLAGWLLVSFARSAAHSAGRGVRGVR